MGRATFVAVFASFFSLPGQTGVMIDYRRSEINRFLGYFFQCPGGAFSVDCPEYQCLRDCDPVIKQENQVLFLVPGLCPGTF